MIFQLQGKLTKNLHQKKFFYNLKKNETLIFANKIHVVKKKI